MHFACFWSSVPLLLKAKVKTDLDYVMGTILEQKTRRQLAC